MFEHLAPYRTIFVTGPQRSGTTIAAQMIAADLGREYIDERDYSVHDLVNLVHIVEQAAVIQGPGHSAYCHLLPAHVAVVFLRRNVDEIIASQQRTILSNGKSWGESEEQAELGKYFRDDGRIAEVKYEAWERFQRPALEAAGKPCFELEYATLAEHPLWVDRANRAGWLPKQTSAAPPQRNRRRKWRLL